MNNLFPNPTEPNKIRTINDIVSNSWSKGNPVPVNTSQGQRVRVVDSHTGGEPTRLVVSGGPDLGKGSLAERLRRFCAEHDRFRSAVVNEPRGSDVIVGALLCEPSIPLVLLVSSFLITWVTWGCVGMEPSV